MKEEESAWTFKSWYAENGAALAEQRKQRYKNDPEYRTKVLEQNKKYREKKKSKKKGPSRAYSSKARRPLMANMIINGTSQELELYNIGVLSRSVGVSIGTLYVLERDGLLPRTPISLVSKNKVERLYSRSQIDVVRDCLASCEGREKTGLCAAITAGWAIYGIHVNSTMTIVKEKA